MTRFTIQYASRRSEVWKWYVRMWRDRLWKTHAAVFAVTVVSTSLGLFGGAPSSAAGLGLVAAIGAAPLVAMAGFPLLMFKPQTRSLTLDETGVDTTIGGRNQRLGWPEFLGLREEGENFFLQRRNLNAFIVPARAFASDAERTQFREFVRARTGAG